MNIQEPSANTQTRLESWKEIGAYLQRDATTARRWEKEEGLPVHRHSHKSRSSVYAYASEIDAWRVSRKVVPEPVATQRLWRWPALGVTMLLCLIMVGSGVHPVSAQQAGGKAARQVWVSRPSEDPAYSVPSLDGRYIGYTDWETGDLGVRDLTTGATRRLTNTGGWEISGDYAQRPVISPDSRQIVYTWFVEKELKNELRVLPMTGGPARILFSSSDEYVVPHAWTPDGNQLLVVHILADRTSQIAMLSVRDGSMRALKSFAWQNLDTSLSPDGRFLAYDSPVDNKTQARDIFVLAVDGSRETAVVQSPADDVEPVWSPDGSRILFLSDRTGAISLWSVLIDNGTPKGPPELVKADMGRLESMGMSRNGTLYYVFPGTSSPNVYSAELGPDMKVSKPPVLAVERFVNSNNGPSLSPDGQYLAYDSFRPGGTVLVVRALKTGEEREVPSQVRVSMIFGYGPMWFPDDGSVLVLSRESQRPGFSFYRVDITSGRAELLHHTSQGIQGYKLSPDGRAIFFTEVTPGSSAKTVTTRLLRFDLGTHSETEMKKGEFFIAVAVSPDSKQLAYLVQDAGARRSSSYLAVMPAEGGEAREVFRGTPWLDGSRYNTLAWTPDQRYLLFVRASVGDNGPSVLWRVPIAGGPPEQMGVSMLARIKSPQIQPDLGRIFFSVNPNSPSEVWALQNFLPKAAAAAK